MKTQKLSSHLKCCKVVDLHSRIYRYEVATRYYRYRFVRKADADRFTRRRNIMLTDAFRAGFEIFGRFSVEFLTLPNCHKKELSLIFNQLNLIETCCRFDRHESAIYIIYHSLISVLSALPSTRLVSSALRDVRLSYSALFEDASDVSADSSYIVIPKRFS